ncbi:acylphosphatase [Mesorhizobium sp. CN2-181]|uniref:acylphosphatase n=1 Tax=Mesorhizobium yinganensis TaxID=3157707 RepID=UPI0032B77D6F
MTRQTTLAHITGRVQGVGFRFWTQEQALALGLSGWVCNEPDGSVKALLAGTPDAVAEMLERLHRGPPGARVTKITTTPMNAGDKEDGFRILR